MKMQNTEMEFVAFDAQDVITTSGELTFTVAGLGNGEEKDATIVTSDGRTIYNAKDYTSDWTSNVASALQAEVNGTVEPTTKFYIDSETSAVLDTLFNTKVLGGGDTTINDQGTSAYNGIYKWISESSSFMKQ